MMDSDADLLHRVAAGEAVAFDQLVERHGPALRRQARRICWDSGLAEDALQDALSAAWRHAGGFRGQGSARAWLHTLLRHAAHRQWRGRGDEPAEEVDLERLGARAGWGDPGLGGRVEAVLGSRECLERAFGRLSLADRELLGLVDVEEASLEEVAESLDLGLPALKSRLHRARLRLVAVLREEDCHAG